MLLYLEVQTNVPDIVIDHIELHLSSGEIVTLTWKCSSVKRTSHGFHAVYTGIFFGKEYAVGKLAELRNMVITDAKLSSKTSMFPYALIQTMKFLDGEDYLEFSPPRIVENF